MEKKSKMKFIKLGRTFKEGLVNFYRNGWLSFATVSVLAISLYIISVTVILGVTANIVLRNMQDKINVSVYFKPSVEESKILDIKNTLIGFKEIKSIEYVTRDQALQRLKDAPDQNDSVNKALEILGENPLDPTLVITAKDPDQYEIISKAISNSTFASDIDHINFNNNKKAIQNLTTIIKLIRQVGTTLGVVFVFIGVLITFNAIRLTMYAHKQEFEIMRLVGASNTYIRMPFVFEGILYGAMSSVIVMVALFITSKFLAPITQGSVSGGDIMTFFLGNFFKIFGSLILSGIVLGVVSSVIAIRRYLKV
ncbi:MAG TPA: permease-like cell division protein FtsX [Patescibacteria group bacterium]